MQQNLAVDVSLGLDWTASVREWLIGLHLPCSLDAIHGLVHAAKPSGASSSTLFGNPITDLFARQARPILSPPSIHAEGTTFDLGVHIDLTNLSLASSTTSALPSRSHPSSSKVSISADFRCSQSFKKTPAVSLSRSVWDRTYLVGASYEGRRSSRYSFSELRNETLA